MMQIAIAVLILIGSLFILVAALGVFRFPDVYCRMHAATKAGAFGGAILAIAAGLKLDGYWIWAEVTFLVLFFYTTMPIAAHLLARSAYYHKVEPTEKTNRKELDHFKD